jgi:Icc-related predicted phosphoesterase
MAWIKREGLNNFLLDIENIKRVFYRPEYKGSRDFLTRSYDDLVYKVFMEALCTRLSTGCLVVVDIGNESTSIIEELAVFFGYTVFYHVERTPSDYIGKNRKYCEPCYLTPTKETLKREITDFNNFSYDEKKLISSYNDLEQYWEPLTHPNRLYKKSKILHVSDLHSHYKIFKNIINPLTEQNTLTIFAGDYIDGPEEGGSRALIDFLIKDSRENIIYLEGNHELRLRKFLAYTYFKCRNKKIISDILRASIPPDFEKTEQEFNGLNSIDAWRIAGELNKKLQEFFIYSLGNETYYCTHGGIRWIEQLSPKYVGNAICSNKNPDRIDEQFSKKYYDDKCFSIHGHCKYPEKIEYLKYPGVINIDTEDEFRVNYLICELNKNFKVCVINEK